MELPEKLYVVGDYPSVVLRPPAVVNAPRVVGVRSFHNRLRVVEAAVPFAVVELSLAVL